MKPKLFKRAGIWFCALPGKPGAVASTPQQAFRFWLALGKPVHDEFSMALQAMAREQIASSKRLAGLLRK